VQDQDLGTGSVVGLGASDRPSWRDSRPVVCQLFLSTLTGSLTAGAAAGEKEGVLVKVYGYIRGKSTDLESNHLTGQIMPVMDSYSLPSEAVPKHMNMHEFQHETVRRPPVPTRLSVETVAVTTSGSGVPRGV
jgi:hypothetical protein